MDRKQKRSNKKNKYIHEHGNAKDITDWKMFNN